MTRRKRWMGAGIAVLAVAVAAFLIAQGGGGGSTPLNAIAKAAEVTQCEPGGRARIEGRVTIPSGEEIIESGSMTFDESGTAEGIITARGKNTGKEVEVTSVSSGTTAYMSSDAFGSLPEGKKWMEIDYSGAVKGESAPAPTQGSSPQEGLKILEHAVDVKKLGRETFNGVPTTHYTGTFPRTEEVFGAKVDASAPQVDVWVDEQGRVRRMKISVTTSVKESEGPTHTEMTIDYTAFERVPTIEVPAADEVFNITGKVESELQEAAEGG